MAPESPPQQEDFQSVYSKEGVMTGNSKGPRDTEPLPGFSDLILAASGDGIYGLDTQGHTTFANPAAVRMCGYTVEEMVGASQHNLIHHTRPDGTPYPRLECPIYAAFSDGKVHRKKDEVFWRKDGTSFPVEYVSTPIWDNGRLIGAVVSFRDITERKQAEKTLRESEERLRKSQSDLHHVSRLSAMGEMASGLAHELNQPLTAVMNYVQAAKRTLEASDDVSSAQVIDYLDKGPIQVDRASNIIRGLRKFINKDNSDRSFEDINEIIEEASKLAFAGSGFENTKFEFQLSKGFKLIFVDKVQVQQVIFNLVRNGMEALGDTRDGHLVIATEKTLDNCIEVFVRDNGPGLDEEIAGRLFQSFVTTKPNGMGVGLSICQSIVEDHAGRLWETRNQDGGMTFHFTLPIVLKDSENGE